MAKYSEEFKKEAIRLSDEIGNKKAAAQLGIPYFALAANFKGSTANRKLHYFSP